MNAHIQILADQEASIADRSAANGAIIEALRRILDCRVSRPLVFLLIEGIEYNTLPLAQRRYTRL